MPLYLDIQSGFQFRLEADAVTLRREVGRPLAWQCMLNVPDYGARPATLAKILESGRAKGKPVWVNPGSDERVDLWPEMRVVRAQPQDMTGPVHKVLLTCSDTEALPDGEAGPTQSRWRVHRVADLLALMRRLTHVMVLTPALEVDFGRVKFADGPNACVVQDGLSDWELAHWVLGQYVRHPEAPLGAAIAVTGGAVRDETATRWFAAFADYASYERLNDVATRTVRPPGSDLTRLEFGGFHSPTSSDDVSVAPVASVRVSRTYRCGAKARPPDDWQTWARRDLPLFLDETSAMIWAVEDRFAPTAELLKWETTLHTVPVGGCCPAAVTSGPRPWLRLGHVAEESKRGPWIKVKLAKEFKDGSNEVMARLSTPYAGADGQTGVHVVPAKDTPVIVAWSGRLGESVVLLGNVRMAEAKSDAPALHFDLPANVHLGAVDVQAVGKTTVKSELSVAVEAAVALRSKASLVLEGDGAAATLSSGTFNVGSEG